MAWALVDDAGSIRNIILYDGVSPYEAPYGRLMEISDDLNIGDNINQEGT